MDDFQKYVDRKRASVKKVPAAIQERWQKRVVARGLNKLGAAGTGQYLADYGKGIAAPKVVALAVCAEVEGAPEMALAFWQKAFELEGGSPPVVGKDEMVTPPAAGVPTSVPGMETPTVDFLPAHLQPGKIVTMQPTDARQPREFYITHEAYWGQPKIDGNRLVVIATEGARYYQSRSLQLRSAPSLEIEGALQALAVECGPMVLDGELVYYDAADAEHRTGAQAATANIEMGRGDVQPRPVYEVFRSLYSNAGDRTGDPESLRIQEAEDLLAWLDGSEWQGYVRMLPTARTTDQKRELAASQEASGREGEVWTMHAGRYLGGKDAKSERTVRTKYLVDLEVVILHLTPTTAEGRPFGAMEVGMKEGPAIVPIGSVGTGYTVDEMHEIAHRHLAKPGQVKVLIKSQGLTEGQQLWHARFVDFVEE